ncbi:MAG: radical SAM protein [Candidatus Buchananbacteria bacterium]|nr:radical SAM protein [Candidatus Buchananbacteria bacterium]
MSHAKIKSLEVLLIHPSRYDNSGFVEMYLDGVIPCGTLRLLSELTQQAFRRKPFASLTTRVSMYEDAICRQHKQFCNRVERKRRPGEKLIVCLVAVQTNQMPRAQNLADYAKKHGAHVFIGGSHITASINTLFKGIGVTDPARAREDIPCPHRMPPEIKKMIDDPKITVVHGEVDHENWWYKILRDYLTGEIKPYYECGSPTELQAMQTAYPRDYLDDFVAAVVSIDDSRGCPYRCKFCASINSHGRKVRCRNVEDIVSWIKRQCISYGKEITVLFASDNIARNKNWRELFEQLRQLKRRGYRFTLWAEADVTCNTGDKQKGFIEAFAKAGGKGLFFGIESMNPANLLDAGKRQNNIDNLKKLFAQCHQYGISVEGGYVIGFPHDSVESIKRDVDALIQAGADTVSFFVLTVLPGSEDHVRAVFTGMQLSPDLNDYDTMHPVFKHPNMSGQEWITAFNQAVKRFYRPENLVRIISRFTTPENRLRIAQKIIWYRWSYFTENSHPMVAGLYRVRSLKNLRPGTTISLPKFILSEIYRHCRYLGKGLTEFRIIQRAYTQAEFEIQCRTNPQLRKQKKPIELTPSGIATWLKRTFTGPMDNIWLNQHWEKYVSKKWGLLNPCESLHPKTWMHATTEVVYALRFGTRFFRDCVFGTEKSN